MRFYPIYQQLTLYFLGHHVRSGVAHHTGIYMHSNNDILDVVDAHSTVGGIVGGCGNPSSAGGPHHPLHQQWSRDSLLGRSYRDVREVVATNTLPNFSTIKPIPPSHSRDNTLMLTVID